MEDKEKRPADEISEEALSMARKDLVFGIILFVFSICVLVSSVFIIIDTLPIAGGLWYSTPGVFTTFIGVVLLILSAGLIWTSYMSGGRFGNASLAKLKTYVKTKKCIRFMAAAGLLAVYIFVLFGRINFCLSTFLYLAASMIFFREHGFAIWKILIIALIVTLVLYIFFGIVAGVPLI